MSGRSAKGRRRKPAASTALQAGNALVLLEGGQQLFPAMMQAMDAAQRVVHLETYIFHFEGEALQVAHALERAALRGVQVRLVVDGVGTHHIPAPWQERFARAGVRWRVYAPLGHLGLLIPSRWRRLHRKLCVVDGVLGFCGGINLIDDRDDLALGRLVEPRLDFSLQVAGPVVTDMVETMEQLWWRLQAVRKARQREFKAAWDALRETRPEGDFSRLWTHQDCLHGPLPEQSARQALCAQAQGPPATVVSNARASLLLRDNVSHRHDIERAYLKAIGESREDVLIANAYFIPGRKLRHALTVAVRRGVRVRLLMQGKYEGFMQYRAARPVYQQLLDAGIEIHEYTPSALHAKVAVIDQAWATVGSTNLDPLSLLLAREANIMTSDQQFCQQLHERLERIFAQSTHAINAPFLAARPWHQRLLDRLAFMLMRLSLYLTGHRY